LRKRKSPLRERGTEGSNPSPSSGESRANLTSWWILAGAEEVDRLFAVSREPARPKPGHRESSGTAISPSSTVSRACPAHAGARFIRTVLLSSTAANCAFPAALLAPLPGEASPPAYAPFERSMIEEKPQSSFSISVNSRSAATNYTDDLLGELSQSGQETHFQFQA
jgi:hypothetical protein